MTDHLREEPITSETVFQGRLLTVRVDTIRLPSGRTATREVVAHPGAVAMVPLLDDNRVLMVRQWRHAAGQALLEIPAGALAPGEDPAECAARELMEEIGYRPGSLTPLCSMFVAPGYTTEKITVYLAKELTPERLAHDVDENIEVVTLSWDEVDDLLLRGELADAKTLVGLLLARSKMRG